MAWTLDPSIGKRMRSSISTLEMMRRATNVLRARLEPPEFRRFMADTLLLRQEDMVDAESIAARFAETLAEPCEMSAAITAENRLEMNAMCVSLCRHLGVDPIRLLLVSFDAKAKVVDGDRSIEIDLKRAWGKRRKLGKPDQLDIKIMLGKGVMLRGSRISARNTQLPEAMTITLPGRRIDEIVQMSWEGWKDIRIAGSARSGDSLILETDAKGVIFNYEFEDGEKSR